MKNSTRLILLFSFLFIFSCVKAQDNIWKDVPESVAKASSQLRTIIPNKYRVLSLDTLQLLSILQSAPAEFSAASRSNPLIIAIPMPNGILNHFSVTSYSMMEPALAARFPNIYTYSGQGIEDRTATIKIDWTGFGFHAMIFSPVSGSVWIDPYAQGNKINYISYYKTDLNPKRFREEGVLPPDAASVAAMANARLLVNGPCLGTQLRTYRLAIACTGEYAVAIGGTTAALLHSAIVTTVNRVNGVYEKEVDLRLVLIANNNIIEFLNAATDPFTGNNLATTLINESQTVINANIGSANYDIGHTFSTGGGGLAQVGCVCSSANKSRGITGSPSPTGDGYDIDYVAHEMGHQFGGQHTFNANTDNCSGNGSSTSNAEPGSGSTIMAYAGICGINDLQPHSDPQFHAISFNEIGLFTRSGGGTSCGTTSNTGNAIPVVNAGANYTIPVSTAFTLTGSATDADNDALTYSWEQINVGAPFSNWNAPSGVNAPLFRSFAPVISPSRTFPRISDIANNTTTIGEILPTIARTMNFRLTARDNRSGGGGVCFAEMAVTTSGTTAFTVTSQAAATAWVANGTNTATITWNVAGTTVAPFNVSAVDILLSVDGGLSFPYPLLTNTPNDGSQVITIPSVATVKGRIMVRSRGNIFFDLNTGTISITTPCTAEGAVIAPAATVTAVAGNAALNLGLNPQYSVPFSPAGSLQSTDPASSLSVFSSVTSACVTAGNVTNYDVYTFTPSITATYTFTLTGVFPTVMNLYSNSYDPAAPCTNFLKSNSTYNGTTVNIATTVTQALSVGSSYVLMISSFDAGNPPLPAAYSVAVSSAAPAGGSIYSGSTVFVNPGASFNYVYVIVNNATGVIAGISATANLINSGTYPAGNYSIYGLSYSNTIANLNSFAGGSLTALLTNIFSNPSTFCANLSKNIVTVVVQAGPVPLNGLVLTARKEGAVAKLNWKTASEQNSDHFIIQRSTDGINFNAQLGRVAAAGNSTSERNYPFTDISPGKQWNYYRIEGTDADGHKVNSNTAALNFSKDGNLIFVYPNPAVDQLTVEYNSPVNGNLSLRLYDSKGSLVSIRNFEVTAGRSVNSFDIKNLASGIYMITYIEPDGNTFHDRFIKK